MLEQVVRLTVNFTVDEENLQAFKTIAEAMTKASKAEPGALGYEWFTHADGKRFRLVETYTDRAAVEAHFAGSAVQELVPKLDGICTLDGFEIYGDPGPKVAALAAGMGAVSFPYWLGIDR
jgi:quinol monooxygenase YgiN